MIQPLPVFMACLLLQLQLAAGFVNRFPFDQVKGVTLLELDTIMSLVSIAENSKTSWWENYDYCEDIGDGRGFTVSLVGFCSGTGDLLGVVRDLQSFAPDHPLVRFIPALEKVDGSDSHEGLENLCDTIKQNNDHAWQQAVWNGVLRYYWNPAVEYAQNNQLQRVISKGFLFDLALNSGSEEMAKIASKVSGVTPPSQGGDEREYIDAYMTARGEVHNDHLPRVEMWKSIVAKGNLDLVRPLHDLKCYGDTFDIVDDRRRLLRG